MLIESVMAEQRGRDATEMDEESNGTSTTPESETDRLSVTHPRFSFLLTAVRFSTSGPSRLPSFPSSVSLLFGWTSLGRRAAAAGSRSPPLNTNRYKLNNIFSLDFYKPPFPLEAQPELLVR